MYHTLPHYFSPLLVSHLSLPITPTPSLATPITLTPLLSLPITPTPSLLPLQSSLHPAQQPSPRTPCTPPPTLSCPHFTALHRLCCSSWQFICRNYFSPHATYNVRINSHSLWGCSLGSGEITTLFVTLEIFFKLYIYIYI